MIWKRQKKTKPRLYETVIRFSRELASILDSRKTWSIPSTWIPMVVIRWRTGDLPWSNLDWVTQDVIEIVVPGVWNSKLIQFRLPVSRQHFAERTLSKWGGSEIKRRKWGQAWINNGKKFHSWCNQSDRNITRGGSKIDGTKPTSITYHGHMHLR